MNQKLLNVLEECPIIAAVKTANIDEAIKSPVNMIFLLDGNILNFSSVLKKVHNAGKLLFVHIDLAEGIGKDRAGLRYIHESGIDGIVSTKSNLIKIAKELGLYTVQRFFVLDSQGVASIEDMLRNNSADIIELMPGLVGKIIEKFSIFETPIVAGGLIETKAEVTAALNFGAFAVSTGKSDLWYL